MMVLYRKSCPLWQLFLWVRSRRFSFMRHCMSVKVAISNLSCGLKPCERKNNCELISSNPTKYTNKQKDLLERRSFDLLVRSRRFELPPPCEDNDLNVARLPFRHDRRSWQIIHDYAYKSIFNKRAIAPGQPGSILFPSLF